MGAAHGGLGPHRDRLAGAVAIPVFSDDGPSVAPRERLQVHDAAIGHAVLEMDEPRLAGVQLHPCALVRPVDVGVALGHNDAVLVGAVDVPRAQDGLPAGGHAPRRGEDGVEAIALVKLGPFDGGMLLGAVKHDPSSVQQRAAIGAHPADLQPVLDPRAAPGERVDQVGLPVIIPKRAGIDPAPGCLHLVQGRPRSQGIGGRAHEDAFVGRAEEHPEPAVMVADAGGPRSAPVSRGVVGGEGQPVEDVGHDAPIDQVSGVQHRQAGEAVEAGRDHIEVVPMAGHIGIGVVGKEDGVAIRAIAAIRHPGS